MLHHCASVPWFCNHSQSHSFFLVIVSFVKETCKSNVSTTAVKDSDLAKHHSDLESSSPVDCRDSDCSDSSACDSDTKYYQRTFTVVDPTAGAHDRHRDSRNPKSVATAEDYANAIRSSNDVFGSATQTDVIRNLTHNTSRYTKALTIIESRFFETLVGNPTLGSLACMDQDPDNGNQPIHRFYLLCCGLQRNATKDIINTAVLWFATKFFKKKSHIILESASDEAIASAMYQPNTAKTKE